MWFRIFIIAFSFLLLFTPFGRAQEEKIALILKASTNPFFIKMKEGAEHYAHKKGITLNTFSITAETDVDEQIHIMEEIVRGGDYDAIVLAPSDSVRLVPVVREALSKGIYVVNVDDMLDDTTMKSYGVAVPFVGPDNFRAAEMVGRYVKFKLNGRGKVLIMEGLPGAINAIHRRKGFVSGLSGSNIEIEGFLQGEWHRNKAFNETISYFSRHKEKIDAILCANDEMALGVVQALELLGKKNVMVTGYDNIDEVRFLIREGRISATVEQNPYLMGFLGVKYADLLIKGGGVSSYTEVPTDLVTEETFGKKIGIIIPPQLERKYIPLLKLLRYKAPVFGETIIYPKRKENEMAQMKEVLEKGADLIVVLGSGGPKSAYCDVLEKEDIPIFLVKTEKPGSLRRLAISLLEMIQGYFIGWDLSTYEYRDRVEIVKCQ